MLVEAGLAVITRVVAPVLHKYVTPVAGDAVNVVEPPGQIVFVPVIEALGLARTVTVRVALSVQPFALVTVTV